MIRKKSFPVYLKREQEKSQKPRWGTMVVAEANWTLPLQLADWHFLMSIFDSVYFEYLR